MDRDRGKDKGKDKGKAAGKAKDKKKFADLVVQLLVPYFKRGRIASKEVFKFLAREMTHVLIADGVREPEAYAKGKIAEFFEGGTSIVLSNDDAREKVATFRARTRK